MRRRRYGSDLLYRIDPWLWRSYLLAFRLCRFVGWQLPAHGEEVDLTACCFRCGWDLYFGYVGNLVGGHVR